MPTAPVMSAGRARSAWLMPAARITTSSLSVDQPVVGEEHGDEDGDRQHDVDEARQDEDGEIEEEPDRKAAIDDEIDEPQRLQQPYRRREADRDEGHGGHRLAEDIARDPTHRG